MERYDPIANTWSAAADLPSAIAITGAALLPSGLVLVVGSSNEIVRPGRQYLVAGSRRSVRSRGSTVTLLKDGEVLLAGDTDNAEVYW